MTFKVLQSIHQDTSAVLHMPLKDFSPFSFAQSTRVSNIMCCLTEHTLVSGSYTASDRWLFLQSRKKTARNAAKVQLR